MRIDDWRLAKVESAIRIQQSPIHNPRRPLEPDTVSTVEGRNSHLMTVPSLSGAVLFWSAVTIPIHREAPLWILLTGALQRSFI